MAFVHLHVHSQYSLLDGAIKLKTLAPTVKAMGQQAVALTDHCNLYGAVQFHKSCKEEGIKAVLGAGLWVQPEGQQARDPLGQRGGYHLVALVEDAVGYKNLSKLITSAIFDGMYYKPRVDLTLLRKHRDGLIFLTSGMRGPVRGHLAQGEPERAQRALAALCEVLSPDNLLLELQDVAFDGDLLANEGCRSLAAEHGLKTVVTNNVHYRSPQDAPVLDLLQCIAGGISLNDPRRTRPRNRGGMPGEGYRPTRGMLLGYELPARPGKAPTRSQLPVRLRSSFPRRGSLPPGCSPAPPAPPPRALPSHPSAAGPA